MCEIPYLPDNWNDISCIQLEIAKETEVGKNGAIFAQLPPPESIYSLALPQTAFWTNEVGEKEAGVVVQAEHHNTNPEIIILGIVRPDGINVVTRLDEVMITAEPSEEWYETATEIHNAYSGEE